jgi:hypothetical protein
MGAMHWIGLVAFAGASAVAIRWLFTRIDTLGRTRPFPWISVVGLVVLGLVALVPFVLRVRLEGRLAQAASKVVGAEVDVHCQSFGEAFVDVGAELGYVPFGPDGVPERHTLIKRSPCGDLSDYIGSDKESPTLEQVVAVHTLSHEAMHMRGETNEAITECAAMQRDAQMARLLGASPEAGRRLAATYWTQIYPRMPGEYRSDDCKPGGSLDELSSDAPWQRGSPGV